MRLWPHTIMPHAHFPQCPRAKQRMTGGRRADWAVRSCPVHPGTHSVWSHPFIPAVTQWSSCSRPLDSETDSCVSESGLCGRIMNAEAESSAAVWTGRCSQLTLRLVTKHSTQLPFRVRPRGCLPSEWILAWLIVNAVKDNAEGCLELRKSRFSPSVTLKAKPLCGLSFWFAEWDDLTTSLLSKQLEEVLSLPQLERNKINISGVDR